AGALPLSQFLLNELTSRVDRSTDEDPFYEYGFGSGREEHSVFAPAARRSGELLSLPSQSCPAE
ncbi:MAG: hypothetical protein RLZZ69_1627, partial [Cyanobacteriota bacterium]